MVKQRSHRPLEQQPRKVTILAEEVAVVVVIRDAEVGIEEVPKEHRPAARQHKTMIALRATNLAPPEIINDSGVVKQR